MTVTLEEKNKLLRRMMAFGERRMRLAIAMDAILDYVDLLPNDELRKRFVKIADEWKVFYKELLAELNGEGRR